MTDPNHDAYDLQIMMLSGPDESSRATTGWALAVSAASSGSRVVVFLVASGARWAERELATTPVHSIEQALTYLQAFLDAGGEIECCSDCLNALKSRSPERETIRSVVRPGGLTRAAIRATRTSTVTF